MVTLLEFKTVESLSLTLRNTLSRLIEQCKNQRELKKIHTQILKSPTLHTGDQYHLTTRLLFFCSFSNYCSFSYATNVFHMIKKPDLRAYNIMIRAYTSMEGGYDTHFCKALMLYKQMFFKDIVPNCLTFPFLLKGCTRRLDGATGHVIHTQVIKCYEQRCFNEGQHRHNSKHRRKMNGRNIITWNSIITGLAQGGRAKESLELFHEMQLLSDDMKAFEIFKEMPEKDASAWTVMILVFALHGLGWKAFYCFLEMERTGVKPNHATFVGLLSACAHSGLVEQGCWLFGESEILIRSMPMKPDVYVWGALLGGCRMHGNVELGEKVAHHLIDLEPHNHAFYVNWCDIYAKAGMFDAAKRIRNLMKEKRIEKKIPGCSMIEIDGEVQEFSAGGSSELPMKELVLVLNGLSNEMNI
ncbi:Pentatricopeptide repeat-containing protein [Glycine max]|nr:Pentatricopeptide repeat-containing protein [Glycine max]